MKKKIKNDQSYDVEIFSEMEERILHKIEKKGGGKNKIIISQICSDYGQSCKNTDSVSIDKRFLPIPIKEHIFNNDYMIALNTLENDSIRKQAEKIVIRSFKNLTEKHENTFMIFMFSIRSIIDKHIQNYTNKSIESPNTHLILLEYEEGKKKNNAFYEFFKKFDSENYRNSDVRASIIEKLMDLDHVLRKFPVITNGGFYFSSLKSPFHIRYEISNIPRKDFYEFSEKKKEKRVEKLFIALSHEFFNEKNNFVKFAWMDYKNYENLKIYLEYKLRHFDTRKKGLSDLYITLLINWWIVLYRFSTKNKDIQEKYISFRSVLRRSKLTNKVITVNVQDKKTRLVTKKELDPISSLKKSWSFCLKVLAIMQRGEFFINPESFVNERKDGLIVYNTKKNIILKSEKEKISLSLEKFAKTKKKFDSENKKTKCRGKFNGILTEDLISLHDNIIKYESYVEEMVDKVFSILHDTL